MTEYLLNEYTDGLGAEDWESATEEQIWDQTMLMAYTVHKSMESSMHAYIWWYLKRYYSFLDDGTYRGVNGAVTKRGYAFSHFSKVAKFVWDRFKRASAIYFAKETNSFFFDIFFSFRSFSQAKKSGD